MSDFTAKERAVLVMSLTFRIHDFKKHISILESAPVKDDSMVQTISDARADIDFYDSLIHKLLYE